MYRIQSSFEHTDTLFDIGSTTEYEISISVSTDGFSFCIANPNNFHVLFIKKYNFAERLPIDEIAELYSEISYWDELLRRPYQEIKLMFTTSKYTLVPDTLYNAQYADKLLETLYMQDKIPERLIINKLESLDVWCISSIPVPLYQALHNHHPTAKLYSSAVPICERMLPERHAGFQTHAIINKNNSSIDLYITENCNLTLHNHYTSHNYLDMGYFIVNAVNQLSLDPDQLLIRIIGEIEQHSDEVTFLKRYFKNVVLEKNLPIFHGKIIDKIPIHRYINLINLHLCE